MLPFFPETILPAFSSGLPATALPCAVNRSNQAFHWPAIVCISSGERPLCQSLPRNRSMYSDLVVCALINFLLWMVHCFRSFHDTTNARSSSGHLFCVLVRPRCLTASPVATHQLCHAPSWSKRPFPHLDQIHETTRVRCGQPSLGHCANQNSRRSNDTAHLSQRRPCEIEDPIRKVECDQPRPVSAGPLHTLN